ncbi:major capsid protein E [Lactobacillus curvatus] [Lactiplantibacillus mudanjiangensis]|nr:major capsid protein E [Lactobacillus curvatus] [Lactiplantibacillus mudanjiangensis]
MNNGTFNIFDVINASTIAGFWNTNQAYSEPWLMETLMPSTKQSTSNIRWTEGQDMLPEVMTATELDADVTMIQRSGFLAKEAEALHFINGVVFNEKDCQDLMNARYGNDNNLFNIVATKIFNDQTRLLTRAALRREQMALDVLLTGKVTINDNGVVSDMDYNYKSYQMAKSKADWGSSASNPYDDIYAIQQTMGNKTGTQLTRAIMNQNTFNKLVGNSTLKSTLLANNANTAAAFVPKKVVTDFIMDELGLSIAVYNKGKNVVTGSGKSKTNSFETFIPDDKVVLLPGSGNEPIGSTVFVPTPEEINAADLAGTVAIADTGVAIHTFLSQQPVNKTTVASQCTLPRLDAANQVAVMDVSGK